jgi:hypothetical protein
MPLFKACGKITTPCRLYTRYDDTMHPFDAFLYQGNTHFLLLHVTEKEKKEKRVDMYMCQFD